MGRPVSSYNGSYTTVSKVGADSQQEVRNSRELHRRNRANDVYRLQGPNIAPPATPKFVRRLRTSISQMSGPSGFRRRSMHHLRILVSSPKSSLRLQEEADGVSGGPVKKERCYILEKGDIAIIEPQSLLVKPDASGMNENPDRYLGIQRPRLSVCLSVCMSACLTLLALVCRSVCLRTQDSNAFLARFHTRRPRLSPQSL